MLRSLAERAAKKKYQLIAMGEDRANGVATHAGGRLKIDYKAEENPIYGAIAAAFVELERASGWRVKFDQRTVLTAHLMGGCRIADDPAAGVVNGRGEVHGHPGLFVADASALPRPAAVPPSLTIAAWASHVADQVA
jgi:cholesterol oxidase